MSTSPHVGLSLMLEADFVRASLPLFEAGEVDVLEWSFDVGWSLPQLPDWADGLLQLYSQQDRLLGHGVTFSPLSAAWTERQEQWLAQLAKELERRQYLHLSEHFGFMTAGDFHRSAPLPVPLCAASLRLGQARLRQLREQTSAPVGLENLAFAFGREDVAHQGRFLDELLAPVEGFLLLDLHNLYCQSCNFGLSMSELLDLYPLHRVRELHVSGGSWSMVRADCATPGKRSPERIRRDTHDDAVPAEVFAALPEVLARCPQVMAVILERLGGTFRDPQDEVRFRDDFRRLRRIVQQGLVHGAGR